MLDKLATEFGINVAILNRDKATPDYTDPKKLLQSIEGRSQRIGACVGYRKLDGDGIKPIDGLAVLKDRLIGVHLRTGASW